MSYTMEDIAKLAGVSTNTVSRALNGKKEISEETRKRIKKIANELNYTPNSIAASLASQKTNMIGVITPDISDPFHALQVRGIESTARKNGYSVILINADENPETELQAVNTFRSIRVAGIILNTVDPGLEHIEGLVKTDTPLVLLNRRLAGIDADYVINDNFLGAMLAIRYLIELNHTRIGVILGSPRITSVQDRYAGFLKAMDEAGVSIDPELVIHSEEQNPYAGEMLAQRLLASSPRPSAIFAYCDTLAIGAYNAALKMGLSVPDDVSIIGYDDIIYASCFEVPLTTVAQPAYQMGQTACEIIIGRIQAKGGGLVLKDLPKKQVVVQPQLVIRKSCGLYKLR